MQSDISQHIKQNTEIYCVISRHKICYMMRRSIIYPLVSIAVIILTMVVSFAQQVNHPNEFDLLLIYYKRSGLPIPWSSLAQHFDDYRRASNEFDRERMLVHLRPVIEKQLLAVEIQESFVFSTKIVIGEYDFDHGAFPLSITPLMYSEFITSVPGPPLAILFVNADKFTTWSLSRDDGSQLLARLGGIRSVAADIIYRPVRAREGYINNTIHRIIDVEILSIKLSTYDRNLSIGVLLP